MAREANEREDLMREATALVRRVELHVPGEPLPVEVGFRRDGSPSIFFGGDPVVQFNSRNELRRGYLQGRLIKADRGWLAVMERVRTPEETQLVRHEMTATEMESYLRDVEARISRLRAAFDAGEITAVRQIPESEDVCSQVRAWLGDLSFPLRIAAAPHLG